MADAGLDGGDASTGACTGSAPTCYGSCNVDDIEHGVCLDGGWVCHNYCPCINNQGPPDLCYSCTDGGLGPQQLCDMTTDTFFCPDGSVETPGACPTSDASDD
jgi:hypothetical protein